MAVEAFKTTELGEDYRKYPVSDHGKLRIQFFTLPATTVAGDANTTIDLCKLPAGRVRILPRQSFISTSAFGSGRTLDVGHLAYDKRDASLGSSVSQEAAVVDALIDGLDVSSAVNGVQFSTALKFDMYSKSGVTIQAKVLGGTIPSGATIAGYITYVYE
ncbi:hypothetical protein EKK58_09280 [Candidatus Dependentiae bacterium]|nr:MAG: hypothetical protein EKK58_09280 [Candidatus Dependentiae bacterium]